MNDLEVFHSTLALQLDGRRTYPAYPAAEGDPAYPVPSYAA